MLVSGPLPGPIILYFSRDFRDAGQLLKIQNCPGDSGTVGAYDDVVCGKFHLVIYMIPCYFYDLLDCESLSPTDSGMMHQSSSFVQKYAI